MKEYNKKTAEYKILETLQKFCTTDETRYNLLTCFFDSENDSLVATDGRALLLVDNARNLLIDSGLDTEKSFNFKFKSGLIIKVDEKTAGKFPNWGKVIPDNNHLAVFETYKKDTRETYSLDFTTKTYFAKNVFCVSAFYGYVFNLELMEQIKGFKWELFINPDDEKKSKALLFKTKYGVAYNLSAVIMPMIR